MLRITRTVSKQLLTINLEGKLLGPWTDELRILVAEERAKGQVRVNLEQLSFADAAGLETLDGLRRSGINLIGGSPFIEGLLTAFQVSNNVPVTATVHRG